MAIAFLSPNMQAQFDGVHPDVRELLLRFDAYAVEQGLPATTLTEVWRTPADQVRIYVPFWEAIVHKSRLNPNELSASQQRELASVLGLTKAQLERKALARPSNHLWRCAVDVRTKHYTPTQKQIAATWFSRALKVDGQLPAHWEFLVHDIAGPHIHVGRRDADWKAKFDPRPKGAPHA